MNPWKRSTTLRAAEVSDCDTLSEIHGRTFKRGWSNAEFESLLVQPGVHALVAHHGNRTGRRMPAGFILYRLAADEAEILSVAVIPECRRRGIGKKLLEEALRHAYREGASDIHLEVEDSNLAAIALYRGVEFRESGRRSGYYTQGRETPAGALVMLRQLR
ncbi:MAG: ribosomal protein S18-alanine N-acetyltransferase [Propylenella sp.]